MLGARTYDRTLACATVVCVHAGENILVSFQVGEEGWPSKYTRLLVGLFLRWISELQSALYSGVSKQNDCYKKNIT